MKLSEKLRKLRKEKNITQVKMAEVLGVTLRTYKSYELDESRPRYKKIYEDIANFFDVDVNYLIVDDEFSPEFLVSGCKQLFSGGTLNDSDKKAVFEALKQAYLDSLK